MRIAFRRRAGVLPARRGSRLGPYFRFCFFFFLHFLPFFFLASAACFLCFFFFFFLHLVAEVPLGGSTATPTGRPAARGTSRLLMPPPSRFARAIESVGALLEFAQKIAFVPRAGVWAPGAPGMN